MLRGSLFAAACVLLAAMAMAAPGAGAQAGGASDPVTGNWGTAGLVFLELTFDGHRTVTGTTIWRQGGGVEQRAPIKTGTFDTHSRRLTLSGDAERNGKRVQYEIRATIKDDTLTGTSTFGGERKSIQFARQ